MSSRRPSPPPPAAPARKGTAADSAAHLVRRLEAALRAQREARARAARGADHKRLAGAPPPPANVRDLPEELLQLVTRQLARASAGSALALCDDVRSWCMSHPTTCAGGDDALWREVFALAFGAPTVADPLGPGGLDAPTWRAAFSRACAALGALPAARRRAWAGVARWSERALDDELLAQCDRVEAARRQHRNDDVATALRALLRARGATLARRDERVALDRQLGVAILDRHTDGVAALLAQGADAAYVNEYGVSRLAAAVMSGNVEVVRALLEHGARAVIDVHGRSLLTPLAQAALNGNVAVVRLLLDAGADRDVRSSQWPDGRELWTARRHLVLGTPRFASEAGRAILDLLDAPSARVER